MFKDRFDIFAVQIIQQIDAGSRQHGRILQNGHIHAFQCISAGVIIQIRHLSQHERRDADLRITEDEMIAAQHKLLFPCPHILQKDILLTGRLLFDLFHEQRGELPDDRWRRIRQVGQGDRPGDSFLTGTDHIQIDAGDPIGHILVIDITVGTGKFRYQHDFDRFLQRFQLPLIDRLFQCDEHLDRSADTGGIVIGRGIGMTEMSGNIERFCAFSRKDRFDHLDLPLFDRCIDISVRLWIRRIRQSLRIALLLQHTELLEPARETCREDKTKSLRFSVAVIPPEAGIIAYIRHILRGAKEIRLIQIIRQDAHCSTLKGPAKLFYLCVCKQQLAAEINIRIVFRITAAIHIHDLQRYLPVIGRNALGDDLDRIFPKVRQLQLRRLDDPAPAIPAVPLREQPIASGKCLLLHRIGKQLCIDLIRP